jgi:hypothetical protein
MQPRQPRLGDILDDYCPRERRITNHAVVAMVGQDVKQTRCTTCDAEHEYKHAKIPAQRKKKTGPGALYDEVLTGMPRKVVSPVAHSPSEPPTAEPGADNEPSESLAPVPVEVADEVAEPAPPSPVVPPAEPGEDAEGPVHRPLIRATLPRPEGQAKERPIPEFTARTAAQRPGRFRPHGGGQGHGQGHQRQRGGQAHAGGHQPAANRGGRRGPGPFATAGAHGNRAPGPQGDRQGHRRPGGRNRSK